MSHAPSSLRSALCAMRSAMNHMIKYIHLFIIGIVLTFVAAVCDAKREHFIEGGTMGTTYHITVVTGSFQSVAGLKEKIDFRLKEINHSMSTYQKDSEISRFNRFSVAGQKFKISSDFFQVMEAGQTIYRLSDGAWDATVNPLLELWGFGPGKPLNRVPPQNEIAALLPDVGFSNIEILPPDYLMKKRAAVTIDLSSIAKGYGVDQVARLLDEFGFADYLVEIGGEVYAAGVRPDRKAWRVGINQPNSRAGTEDVYAAVDLGNQAMATSGDYRNFYRSGDRTYSHIIDPHTGFPVHNGVVSTSVIADNCTFADGLATALMVLGPEKGVALLNRLPKVEGVIIVRHENGELQNFPSQGLADVIPGS
jgi:thiamine biosynthesis lipoprotein